MTILKALKDRIRSMGGETNATNIADAIKDLPKGGSSELPPEVSNAVETHGMGWTSEEEITEITWDGIVDDTSLLLMDMGHLAAEVNIDVNGLIGKSASIVSNGEETVHIITSVSEMEEMEGIIFVYADDDPVAVYLPETIVDVETFKAGIYLPTFDTDMHDGQQSSYVSALEIPAIAQEVVHQIDSKYTPESPFKITLTPIGQTGAFWTCSVDKTVEEISQAILDGRIIIVTSVNIQGYTFCKIAGASVVYDGDIYFGFRNSGTEERPSGGDMYLEYDSESSEWTAKIGQPL